MVTSARWFAGFAFLGSFATLAAMTGACIDVLGLEELHPAATDAAVEAGEGQCAEDSIEGIPPAPTDAPSGTTSEGPYLFAVSQLDVGLDLDRALPGFNIDHRNTSDLTANGCAFGAGDRGVILQYAKDPPSGVDNVTAKLLGLLGTFSPNFTAKEINAQLRRGSYGIIFSLQDWNGTSDDPAVGVQAFPALSLEGAATADASSPAPTFTAADKWQPDGRFDPALGGTPLRSAQAWVRDGILTARFLALTFPFRAFEQDPKPFDLRLLNAWVSARITKDASGMLSLTYGGIGARLRTNDLFREMRMVNVGPSLRLCSVPGLVTFLRGQTCTVRDIRENYCDDNRDLPCQGLSFGAGFEAYQVASPGTTRILTKADYAAATERLEQEYGPGNDVPPPEERCTSESDAPATMDCDDADGGDGG